MMRVTEKQAAVILKRKPPKRKNKYGAMKTTINGTRFDSKREGKRYNDLVRLEMVGKIDRLSLQPTYEIEINGIFICKVRLDFKYFDLERRRWIIEDSKGRDNPVSRLKRKLVEAQFKIRVELV